MSKAFRNQYNFIPILDSEVLAILQSEKSNDVSDISMTLVDTLSNKNIKMESMSSPFHNIFANTPSIPSINHHSINWNQPKKSSTSLKVKYQRPLNTKSKWTYEAKMDPNKKWVKSRQEFISKV
jgi:hypothetical protein